MFFSETTSVLWSGLKATSSALALVELRGCEDPGIISSSPWSPTQNPAMLPVPPWLRT